jgi:hypothetical protein
MTTTLPGQSSSTSGDQSAPAPTTTKTAKSAKKAEVPMKPFSRFALGGGISLMGIDLQAATNVERHLNLRGTGNVFSYSVNNIKVNGNNGSNGVDVSGNLKFATAGVSLDYYPFPTHGFRLSPGVMLYNENNITASGTLSGGNSITLGPDKFYSNDAQPMTLNASLGLNTHKQSFTMTTGWGNMISRKDGHWSFPFELGAAFTGVPTVGMTFQGYGCTASEDVTTNPPSNTCVNMNSNSTALNDISAQIAKYQKDLNSLQVYPIFSFGVSYAFHVRK